MKWAAVFPFGGGTHGVELVCGSVLRGEGEGPLVVYFSYFLVGVAAGEGEGGG